VRNKESRERKTTPFRPLSVRKVKRLASLNVTPESILTSAAYADLALELARWILRRWNSLPPIQRSALTYALELRGNDRQVTFVVPLDALLDAIIALCGCHIPFTERPANVLHKA
jgi:hypothetical protein